MSNIWKIIAKLGVEIHPDRIGAMADKIASMDTYHDFDKIMPSFVLGNEEKSIDSLGKAWRKNPDLSPLEIAAALRGSSVTAGFIEKLETIEMVWTGPFTGLVPSRHTEQVLLEVIFTAKRSLFLVSFIAYDIDVIMKALQDTIDRKVRIDILLESSKERGGKVDIDSIDAFLKKVPTANIYAWHPEAKDISRWSGAVHAKCAVADGNLAFITSANLTGAAMERNMELGVLVRGGNLPDKLSRHLEALITTGIVKKV